MSHTPDSRITTRPAAAVPAAGKEALPVSPSKIVRRLKYACQASIPNLVYAIIHAE